MKFGKTQATQNIKPDNSGLITVYEKSPLAIAIMGRAEGETWQNLSCFVMFVITDSKCRHFGRIFHPNVFHQNKEKNEKNGQS